MRIGSLFTGIGGFDLGLQRAGHEIGWQVECDPFCRRVLARHWPDVACGTDVRAWSGDGYRPIDVLVGGWPCQDLSVAGRRAGLAGARSGLFSEILRLAQAFRPRYRALGNAVTVPVVTWLGGRLAEVDRT